PSALPGHDRLVRLLRRAGGKAPLGPQGALGGPSSRICSRSVSRIVPRFDFRIEHASRTDLGLVRKNNEDALLEAPEHALFGIADGMGGLADGEVAARLALETSKRALCSPA